MGSPIDIMDNFKDSSSHWHKPNMYGVRFAYADAVAKSLEELTPFLLQEAENLNRDKQLSTIIKDGSDCLGDVPEYTQKGDTPLPNKAYHYAFAIMKIEVTVDEETFILFEEENPNSVRCNKTLLNSICDENDTSSMPVSLNPVECERDLISSSTLTVENLKHKVKIVQSMVDEKKSRKDGGLQGSGSNYLCDVCDADHVTGKEKLGTFKINRKISETKEISETIRTNPDKLSKKELDELTKE